jgi:hypothetical protein
MHAARSESYGPLRSSYGSMLLRLHQVAGGFGTTMSLQNAERPKQICYYQKTMKLNNHNHLFPQSGYACLVFVSA